MLFTVVHRVKLHSPKIVSNAPRTNWSIEQGYGSTEYGEDVYPYRTFGAGTENSLQIYFKVSIDDFDHLCTTKRGFKFELFTPGDAITKLQRYVTVALDRSTTFLIRPKLTLTSSDIHRYSSSVRGCYLSSERYL